MTPAQAASELAQVNRAVSKAIGEGVRKVRAESAKVARTEHRAQAIAAAGSDRRMRNAGVLDVKTKAEGDDLLVIPVGAWGLVEEGAKAHMIGNRRHPGTKATQGKQRWTKGQDAVEVAMDKAVPKIIDAEVERGFSRG